MLTSSSPMDGLQQQRRKAWQLKQHGWRHGAIAEALGVTTQAVDQWLVQYPATAQQRIPPKKSGLATSLTGEQQQHLLTLLRRLPADFGFRQLRWTPVEVQRLIQQLFDITLQREMLEEVVQWLATQPEEQIQVQKQGRPAYAIPKARPKKHNRIRKLQMLALDQHKQSTLSGASSERAEIFQPTVHGGGAEGFVSVKFKVGPPAKLTLEQLQTLPEVLLRPPHVYGLGGNVWTYKQIALVIEQVYQVSFSPDYIPDFLKRAHRRLEKLGRSSAAAPPEGHVS